MKSLGWWLRKEFREHRVTLALLGVVLLFGSWLVIDLSAGREVLVDPTHGVGEVLGPGMQRRLEPHHLERSQWEALVAAGLALTVLVSSGGLFAGEARRATLPLIARSPGAWPNALAAKVAFLVLVAAAAVLVQGVLLAALAEPYRLEDGGQPVRTWLLYPREELGLFVWFVLGLGAWALVASAALPLVGVPAFVGTVAGVATLLPAIIWSGQYPYLLRWWIGDPRWFLLVWALVALGTVVWVWLRGMRYGRRPLRIGLACLAVAGVFAGAATAVLGATAARYRNFDATIPDLRIGSVSPGPGGRFVYAQVYRGDPSSTDERIWKERHGTPSHAWRIDLTDGSWTELGGEGHGFEPASLSGNWARVGEPLLSLPSPGNRAPLGLWIDARTGEVIARGSLATLPPDADERLRASLRATTRVRDGQGRPAWFFRGRIEKDGIEPISVPEGLPDFERQEISGGWAWITRHASVRGSDSGRLHLAQTLDADTGRLRQVGPLSGPLSGWAVAGFLDPGRALIVAPRPPMSGFPTLSTYRILDIDTGTTEPLLATDHPGVGDLVPLAVLGRSEALVSEGPGQAKRVALVDLALGTKTPLAFEGDDMGRVDRVFWLVGREMSLVAHAGPLCLSLIRQDAKGSGIGFDAWQPDDFRGALGGRWRPPVDRRIVEALAVYDSVARRLRVVRGWGLGAPWAVEANGAVLATEGARRIVRFGPEPGQREVLFPRR